MNIDVYRTHIILHPYNRDNRIESLERLFSVRDEYFQYNPIGLYLDTENEELRIPRGINISKLESIYDCNANIIKGYDDYNKLIAKLNYEPRDDNQTKAIAFLLGEGDYKNNKSYARKILELDTSMGKTYCATACMCYLKIATGIIVNSELLLEQWIDRITEYTNISEKEIFIVKGAASVNKIMKDKCKKVKVFIISHDTISSYGNKYGWHSVTELFKKMKIGLKIYDEAHLAFANIIKIDLFTNTRYTYYLSATAERTNIEENKLYKRIFGSVPILSIHRTKEEAYVNGIVLKYETEPTYIELGMMKNKKGMNVSKYMDYMVYGKGKYYFFKALRVVLNTMLNEEGSIMILLSRKRVIATVKEYIENEYPDIEVGIITSDVKGKEERKNELTKKVILSTYGSFGTGSDVDNVRTLYMCEPYSSKRNLRQCLGRLRYKKGRTLVYIELVDEGVPSRSNQFSKVEKTLLSLCKKVQAYEIN